MMVTCTELLASGGMHDIMLGNERTECQEFVDCYMSV